MVYTSIHGQDESRSTAVSPPAHIPVLPHHLMLKSITSRGDSRLGTLVHVPLARPEKSNKMLGFCAIGEGGFASCAYPGDSMRQNATTHISDT